MAPHARFLGAVDATRFDEGAVDAIECGEEQNEGPSHALPDADEPDDGVAGPRLGQPVDLNGMTSEQRENVVRDASLVGEDVGEDVTHHDPRRDHRDEDQGSPEPATRQAIGHQRGGEEAECHLDGDRDDAEEKCVEGGGANLGIVEDPDVVGPTHEGVVRPGEDVPVVETDIELAIDRIDDEDHV